MILVAKIVIYKLTEGTIIAEPVFCPKTGNMLANYGTKVTHELIQSLKSREISQVTVLDENTLIVDPIDTTAKELKKLLIEEIRRLAPDKAEANTSDTMVKVSRIACQISVQIVDNTKLVEFCVLMKILNSRYLYQHSIGTCALSLLVAGAMGLSNKEIFIVGTGALLHDVGLCEMPALIKHEKLNPQQELLWKEHPRYGYYFAKDAGFPFEITNLIQSHHEFWNGSGFPQGLTRDKIPPGARIISVCESYDRLLRYEGYPHYQAIEYLYGGGNYYYDSAVVQSFINNLAVYPLGSLVRLSTGEVGVVANVRQNLGPRPVVTVYYNRVNRPLTHPYNIDLGKERTVFIEKVL